MAELWLNAAAGPRGIGSAASSNSTSMAETILVVTGPSFVRRNAAVVVAGPVGLRMAVIAQITVVLVGREQKTIPEVRIAVVVWFATRRPITVRINRTAKGPLRPASHAGAIVTALGPGRPKAATQIAATQTAKIPPDVGCTAACEATATTA